MPNQSNVADISSVGMSNAGGSAASATPSGRRNHRNNQSSQCAISAATAVKTAMPRYNRRNNPELEKRRIHHCDFLGMCFVCARALPLMALHIMVATVCVRVAPKRID